MLEYLDEIEADFVVFYRIFDYLDEPRLDGPKFLRLASQLPRYDGAVRRRIEMEQHMEQQDDRDYSVSSSGMTQGQTMSMAEAVGRSTGDEMSVLKSLNNDSVRSDLGNLFEYETA